MGSGKTTIGGLLAARLQRSFVDVDDRIEAAAGRRIAEIFDLRGEAAFRDLESRELDALLARAKEPLVIALGGGAFAEAGNRERIARSGALTVFLECPLDVLRERCAQAAHRPLARDPDAFARLLEARAPAYRQASVTVATGSGTPEEAVEQIALAALAAGVL